MRSQKKPLFRRENKCEKYVLFWLIFRLGLFKMYPAWGTMTPQQAQMMQQQSQMYWQQYYQQASVLFVHYVGKTSEGYVFHCISSA